LTNLFQLAKKVTNLFQMGVSNLFRLTQKVSFDEHIPIIVDELIPIKVDEPIPLDVSVLFSRPGYLYYIPPIKVYTYLGLPSTEVYLFHAQLLDLKVV
jgi:hypothetical protein